MDVLFFHSPICLSAHPPIRPSTRPPIRPSARPPFSPSSRLPFRLSACPPIRLSACPLVSPYASPAVRPSARLPAYLSARLPIRPSAHPPVRPSPHPPVFPSSLLAVCASARLPVCPSSCPPVINFRVVASSHSPKLDDIMIFHGPNFSSYCVAIPPNKTICGSVEIEFYFLSLFHSKQHPDVVPLPLMVQLGEMKFDFNTEGIMEQHVQNLGPPKLKMSPV
jgi:hypothetical protein